MPIDLWMPPVLATLHLADLYRDPTMRLPTKLDWQKIPKMLAGTWPLPTPPWKSYAGGPDDTQILAEAIPELERAVGPIAIDTEYSRDRSHRLFTVGVGWRARDGQIRGVQIMGWPRLGLGPRTALSQTLAQMVKVNTIVFQNALADAPVLQDACGIPFPDGYWSYEDLMLAHAVLWSEWPHGLEFLASIYSPYPKMKHLAQDDPELYNWGDVVDTLVAWEAVAKELKADPLTEEIYRSQSLKLLPELARRKRTGIRVNGARITSAYAETHATIEQATRIGRAAAGWPVNLGSNKQIGKILYEQGGHARQFHKRTRKTTIDADAVATLRAHVDPAPDPDVDLTPAIALDRITQGADPILEARVLYADALQIQSHYLEPGLRALETDGRFYPDQLIHAQASGRWSTNDPPLAQLPKDLHDIVMPDPGTVWLGWDWDQIELRINAAQSNDVPTLLAFRQGWDIHTLNTCDCLGIVYPPNRTADLHTDRLCTAWRTNLHWEGKDDPRRVFAKRFVFRLDYGGDPARAGDIPGAKALGLDSRRLVLASNRYLAQHPEKAAWRREIAKTARESHTIRTFKGRLRRLLGTGKGIEREAFNHPMQGGVVDIFNLTFVAVTCQLPHLRWLYGVHDAQWWECPADRVAETWPKLKALVEREWTIGGMKITIPATYKERRP